MHEAHCCGADKFFDLKGAEKEYRAYLKSGPGKVTKKLIQALSSFERKDKTLLDIGGGIGAIAWDFHENNATSTTGVDASHGYLKVAEQHAQKMGWEEKTVLYLETSPNRMVHSPLMISLPLDKVVCCYPDYESILESSTQRSNHVVGLTFPLGGPVAAVLAFFARIYLSLKKNSFHPYVHPSKKIQKKLEDLGFHAVHKSIAFPWRVWVFEKKSV